MAAEPVAEQASNFFIRVSESQICESYILRSAKGKGLRLVFALAAWLSLARPSPRPPPVAVAAMAAALTDEDAGGSAKSDAARGRLTGILSITFRYKTVLNKAFI